MQPSTQALPRWSDAPSGVSGNAVAQRAAWVDVAKGVGIVLVVIGHAIGGLIDAAVLERDAVAYIVFYAIYTFHMPLFFFLSGLFVQGRLARDRKGFVQGQGMRIVWPYVLWSVVQLAVIAMLGSLVNRPAAIDAGRVVALLWEPASQFWFLHALLLLHLGSAAIVPRLGAPALLAAAVGAYVLAKAVELPVAVAQPFGFGVFYAAGVWLGPALIERMARLSRHHALVLAAVGWFVFALAATAAYIVDHGRWSPGALPAAIAGMASVVFIARAVAGVAASWLSYLGRHAMAIFVLHVMFVAGTRIALHKLLGVHDPAVLLIAATAAGLIGPLLVRAAAARWNLTRSLGLA